ncbi:MAG: hypothetical protein AAGA09_05040 [Pseudomonadota bacterium]
MKAPTHSLLELSPNGRYLAFQYAETKEECINYEGQISKYSKKCADQRKEYRAAYQMAIYDVTKKELTSLMPLPPDFYVNWFAWANDDRLLAAIRRRSTSNKKGSKISYGGSRIISLPRSGGDYITLFNDSRNMSRANFRISSITSMLPNDPNHVIIPAYKGDNLDLWKVNVNSGAYEQIAKGKVGTFSWMADVNGKPLLRLDTTLLGRRVTVHAWNDETGKWENVRTIRTKRWNENEGLEFRPVATTDVAGQLVVVSDEEEGVRRAIKIYDYRKKDYVDTIYEHPLYDVGGAFINSATGEYAGAWYYDDRLQFEFEDKAWNSHFRGLNAFFDNASNLDIVSTDKSGEKLVLLETSPNSPGDYYLYDRAQSNLEPIFSKTPDLAAAKFGTAEILETPTRDGETVTAYVTHPASGKNAVAPLLVMPHGGPEVRDYFDYDRTVQYFATRGYRILQVNFRGSSGYGRPIRYAWLRRVGRGDAKRRH